MTIQYPKQYTSPTDLVALLKSRGLTIADESKAANYIMHIGYYRLSAYLYPLLTQPKTEHIFKPNSTFLDALTLYRFDKKLRLLIFNEIEKIEIAVRSAIANITSVETNDIFWMTSPSAFANSSRFNKSMGLIYSEYQSSKEEFIEHFRNTYSDPYPPSWQLIEILPLGVVTRIYENIASFSAQKKIARHFGLNIPVFKSWMTIITLTRNACCHHSRVWNKVNTVHALSMHRMNSPWISPSVNQLRIFYNLSIIKHFIDIISPSNNMKQHLKQLLADFPQVDITAMGFPPNWEEEPLWKD
jgi:abortive infection bacteriophage resistance protein